MCSLMKKKNHPNKNRLNKRNQQFNLNQILNKPPLASVTLLKQPLPLVLIPLNICQINQLKFD